MFGCWPNLQRTSSSPAKSLWSFSEANSAGGAAQTGVFFRDDANVKRGGQERREKVTFQHFDGGAHFISILLDHGFDHLGVKLIVSFTSVKKRGNMVKTVHF